MSDEWGDIDHPAFAMRDRAVAAARRAIVGAKRATVRSTIHGRTETVDLTRPGGVDRLLALVGMLDGVALAHTLIDPDPTVRRKPRRRKASPAASPPDPDAEIAEPELPDPDVTFWTGPDEPIVGFARDVLGFALSDAQAGILNSIYGHEVQTAVLRAGRRGGKGRVAAVVAAYEATVGAARHLAAVPAGEEVEIVIVAVSQKQARRTHKYIADFLRRPPLAHLVDRVTDDEIILHNGIVVATVPCNASSARGRSVAVVILDEAAWFAGRDGSPLDVGELWSALVPATAMFPHRRILVASTPRLASGWFYDTCELARAGRFGMREYHATTRQLNPRTDAGFLAGERERDPINYVREYLARFEAAISAALDPELVRMAIVDRGELPPERGAVYLAALDAGFIGDKTALVIGHREPTGRIVVDVARSWQGSKREPLPVEATIGEVTELLASYNRCNVIIDQHAAAPIGQSFRARRVGVLERPWTNDNKLDALAGLREELYGRRVELPRHEGLIGELVALEQRALPSGRPRIAAPGSGADDYATATMALVAELRRGNTGRVTRGPDIWQ